MTKSVDLIKRSTCLPAQGLQREPSSLNRFSPFFLSSLSCLACVSVHYEHFSSSGERDQKATRTFGWTRSAPWLNTASFLSAREDTTLPLLTDWQALNAPIRRRLASPANLYKLTLTIAKRLNHRQMIGEWGKKYEARDGGLSMEFRVLSLWLIWKQKRYNFDVMAVRSGKRCY